MPGRNRRKKKKRKRAKARRRRDQNDDVAADGNVYASADAEGEELVQGQADQASGPSDSDTTSRSESSSDDSDQTLRGSRVVHNSLPFRNTVDEIPNGAFDSNNLARLGLKKLFNSQKKQEDTLEEEYMRNFESNQDVYTFSEMSLPEQAAARKLGFRSFDMHILKQENKSQKRSHILRQGLDMGHVNPSGELDRTRDNIMEFFIHSGKEFLKIKPVLNSDETELTKKLFGDIQYILTPDLPNDKRLVALLLQLLGEEWHALLAMRKMHTLVSKSIGDLLKEYPDDARVQMIEQFRWNLHCIAIITSQHDSFLATIKNCMAFKKDTNVFFWVNEKLSKRRKDYRFQKNEETNWSAYSDIVVNPEVVNRSLKQRNKTYDRRYSRSRSHGRTNENWRGRGGRGGRGRGRGRGLGRGRGRGRGRGGRKGHGKPKNKWRNGKNNQKK